jgi:hypothetical protein
MFLIAVKLTEGVLTGPQKRELVGRLTDALAATAGEKCAGRRGAWSKRSRVSAGASAARP